MPLCLRLVLALLIGSATLLAPCRVSRADILVTSFFFNTVDRYDDETGDLVQTGFLLPPTSAPDDFLGLAGIAVNPANNQIFVSGRFSDRIYVFDGVTGSPIPGAETPSGIDGVFLELSTGSQPAGLVFSPTQELVVANNGGTTVDFYNSSTGALVDSISDTLLAAPGGLTYDSGGDLYITNLSGTGTLKYDGSTLTQFAGPTIGGPFVPNGVIVSPTGEVYVADVFGDGIFKYMSDGTEIVSLSGPFIDIDPFMPDPAVIPSTDVNAPSGLLFDQDGNILVAVLGATNPGEGDLNGALLRFAPDGTHLQTLGAKLPPYSAIAFAPNVVPEPSTIALLVLGSVGLAVFYRKRRC